MRPIFPIRPAFVMGAALLLSAGWLKADPPMPYPVQNTSEGPYFNTGLLRTSLGQGSASVFFDPRILATAGHLFVDDWGYLDTSNATFHLRYQGSVPPFPANGASIRRVFIFDGPNGYANTVYWYGQESAYAFNLDVAIAHGYALLNGGQYGPLTYDSRAALESNIQKVILGYTPVLYETGYLPPGNQAFSMHQAGPDRTAFYAHPQTPYLFDAAVASAWDTRLNAVAGMSGGPIMCKGSDGVWYTAGVLVAGPLDFYFSPYDTAGRATVRSLSADVLAQLIPLALGDLGPLGSLDLPGFGWLSQVSATTYYSQDLGWLVFPAPVVNGVASPAAWSTWLASWITTDGTSLWNPDYGLLQPSGTPNLFLTPSVGYIWLGEYNGWTYSARLGWVISGKTGAPNYFYSVTYGWVYADNLGHIYSFDFGTWL